MTTPDLALFLRKRGQLLTGWRTALGQDRPRLGGSTLSARCRRVRRTNNRICAMHREGARLIANHVAQNPEYDVIVRR